VGDAPEQAAFHGSFKKRRAKQQVERYEPQKVGEMMPAVACDPALSRGPDTPRGRCPFRLLWLRLDALRVWRLTLNYEPGGVAKDAGSKKKKVGSGSALASPRESGEGDDDKRKGDELAQARPPKKKFLLAAAAAGAAAADDASPRSADKEGKKIKSQVAAGRADSDSDGGAFLWMREDLDLRARSFARHGTHACVRVSPKPRCENSNRGPQ
jgi:hypothetical protein